MTAHTDQLRPTDTLEFYTDDEELTADEQAAVRRYEQALLALVQQQGCPPSVTGPYELVNHITVRLDEWDTADVADVDNMALRFNTIVHGWAEVHEVVLTLAGAEVSKAATPGYWMFAFPAGRPPWSKGFRWYVERQQELLHATAVTLNARTMKVLTGLYGWVSAESLLPLQKG